MPPVLSTDEDEASRSVRSWEAEVVDPAVPLRIMDRAACSAMVAQAAACLGIVQPQTEFRDLGGEPCASDPERNALVVANWARTQVRVLHEVAHIAGWRGVCRGEPLHGPSFMSAAITVYENVLGIPRGRLESAATAHGLDFIPGMSPALAYHGPGEA